MRVFLYLVHGIFEAMHKMYCISYVNNEINTFYQKTAPDIRGLQCSIQTPRAMSFNTGGQDIETLRSIYITRLFDQLQILQDQYANTIAQAKIHLLSIQTLRRRGTIDNGLDLPGDLLDDQIQKLNNYIDTLNIYIVNSQNILRRRNDPSYRGGLMGVEYPQWINIDILNGGTIGLTDVSPPHAGGADFDTKFVATKIR